MLRVVVAAPPAVRVPEDLRALPPSADLDRMIAAHEAKLATITVPSLIIHGLADDLVPVDNAIVTSQLLTSSHVTTEFVEGAGHNDLLLVDPERYIVSIAQVARRAIGQR